MNAFLVALGFLTRIPVPHHVFDDERARRRSLAWYPAVGLVIGALLLVSHYVMRGWPPLVAASVLLLLWIVATGALHLDGLADSADAWIGGLGDRERTLAIMKDPRCGPAGVVALVSVLLLKFACLASLSSAWPALWVAPVLARSVLVGAFLGTPYVRAGGLGSRLGDGAGQASRIALAMVAFAILWLGWHAWLATAIVLALFAWWRHACVARLGGMTGDTCGALTELTEVAVLLVFAAAG